MAVEPANKIANRGVVGMVRDDQGEQHIRVEGDHARLRQSPCGVNGPRRLFAGGTQDLWAGSAANDRTLGRGEIRLRIQGRIAATSAGSSRHVTCGPAATHSEP